MKKKCLILLFAIFSCAAMADTLYNYGGDYVPEGKVQVIYMEKYFENTVYYKKFSLIGLLEEKDPLYNSIFRAMKHNFLLRVGLPKNYSINVDFLYVYQKIDAYNFNNLQTVSVFTEKYFDWWGALAGVRIPIQNSMPVDSRIFDSRDEQNVILGLFIKSGPGLLRYSAGIYNETCILAGKNYLGNILATASAGANIYASEDQNIDFIVEAAYKARFLKDNVPSVLYLTPQLNIEFFNDFSFIIGMEFYVAASEIFINDYKKPVYMVKINYTANSDKRTVKPAEIKKPETKDKIWWQIDGVDDEMVPESWKDEANRKDRTDVIK